MYLPRRRLLVCLSLLLLVSALGTRVAAQSDVDPAGDNTQNKNGTAVDLTPTTGSTSLSPTPQDNSSTTTPVSPTINTSPSTSASTNTTSASTPSTATAATDTSSTTSSSTSASTPSAASDTTTTNSTSIASTSASTPTTNKTTTLEPTTTPEVEAVSLDANWTLAPGDRLVNITPAALPPSTEKPPTTTTESTTTTSTESTTTSTTESTTESTATPTTSTSSPTTEPTSPPTTSAADAPEEASGNKTLIIIIVVVVIALLLISLIAAIIIFCVCRSSRRHSEPPPSYSEVSSATSSHRVEKQPPFKPREEYPGAPPPGPKGYEPDELSPKQFRHMGALKINVEQPIVMEHELENKTTVSPAVRPDEKIVWDDDQNIVYDIGSEVEEYYKHGQLINGPVVHKRSERAPKQRHHKKKAVPEAQNLRAIRED